MTEVAVKPDNKNGKISRRSFLKLVAVLTAAGLIPKGSRHDTPALIAQDTDLTNATSLPPEQANIYSLDSTQKAPEADSNSQNQSPSSDVLPANEIKEKIDTKPYLFGLINLQNTFTFVPFDMKKDNYKTPDFVQLMPIAIRGSSLPEEVSRTFKDYQNNPHVAEITRVADYSNGRTKYVEGSHTALAHSGNYNNGTTELPFEVIIKATGRLGRYIVGKSTFITQFIDGKRVFVRSEVISSVVRSATKVDQTAHSIDRSANGDKGPNPTYFYDLGDSGLNLSEQARQSDKLHLVACSGDYDEENHKWPDRTLVTLDKKETITESPAIDKFSNQQVDSRHEITAGFIENHSFNPHYGKSLEENGSRSTTPDKAGSLRNAFKEGRHRKFAEKILHHFHPDMSKKEVDESISFQSIMVGTGVDAILAARGASTGTNIFDVDLEGKLHSQRIAFDSRELDDGKITPDLAMEEFLQMHQCDMQVSMMQEYFGETCGLTSPEAIVNEYMSGGIRAMNEIVQKKVMSENGIGGNTYNFIVNGKEFRPNQIEEAFDELVQIAKSITGREYTAMELLDPTNLMDLNDKFREKNLDKAFAVGFNKDEAQIWNLFGLKRNGNMVVKQLLPASNTIWK